MAEFISHIATEPANRVMNSTNDFYNVPRYEWLGEEGTQQYRFPPTFTCDFGHGNDWQMAWNNNAGSEENIKDNYVTRRMAPWKIPSDLADNKHGFFIQKPSTIAAKEVPVIIEGGVGHWMPAPIYRNIGWWWQNQTSVNSNWIVRTPGLLLRNWRTNEERTYSIGWNTTQGTTGTNGQVYAVTGQQKSDPVNALGPDWFIYGVMFHMRSKNTSGAQSPKGFLADVALGWHYPGLSGITKLIIPDKMSWDDFRAAKAAGEVSFYSLNKPCHEVSKVSNGNACPMGNGTKMRARKSGSGNITYLQWEDPDYANYVSGGDTVYVNGNPYLVDSVQTGYCGQEQYQTTQLTIRENIPGVEVAGTNITISLCAP